MSRPLIVDADTHIVEPPDLWTSAVPRGRLEQVPHVRKSRRGYDVWYMGEDRIEPMGSYALAGTRFACAEDMPRSFTELDPSLWDADRRLAFMDATGVHAQVLYPNVAAFALHLLSGMEDRELSQECVRIYNDWVAAWARSSGGRLIPIAVLPIWDLEATLAEAERALAAGHRGILFPQAPSDFGLPHINEKHWDPLWRLCEESRTPINFHVGAAKSEDLRKPTWKGFEHRTQTVVRSVLIFSENVLGLTNLMFSGIPQRFPDLKFVSVESGLGYIPYLMEAWDWQFNGARLWEERPDFQMKPSEYFRRQVYVTYWFEEAGPRHLLEWLGPERVMFETDFPHPTSLPHAAGLRGEPVADVIARAISCIPPEARDLTLWKNAASLYKLTMPEMTSWSRAALPNPPR